LLQLPIFYPDLEIDAVAGDAALGYDIFLHTVYAKLHSLGNRVSILVERLFWR
jgi:hypothetical protein